MQHFDQDFDPVYHDLVPDAKVESNSVLKLVGTGEKCESDGWVITGSCCKCGHKVELTKSTCGRVECPRCHRTWANRGGQRIGARVWGYYETGVTKHVPRHITFELTSVDWNEAKKKAKSLGCEGGALVIHPWRLKKEYQQDAEEYARRHKCNRYDYVRTVSDSMSLLEFSPHCHGLVYGKLVEIKAGSTEYLYRNIRRLGTLEAAEGVAFYLLTHTNCPLTDRAQSVRYFGCCSTQRLKPDWVGCVSKPLICPKCGGEIVESETIELILVKHYLALGWNVVIPGPSGPRIPTGVKKQSPLNALPIGLTDWT